MNVTKITVDTKKLVAVVETDRGADLQVTFYWEHNHPELEKVVAVLQSAILEEAAKAV